jgi:hypothetical protein
VDGMVLRVRASQIVEDKNMKKKGKRQKQKKKRDKAKKEWRKKHLTP